MMLRLEDNIVESEKAQMHATYEKFVECKSLWTRPRLPHLLPLIMRALDLVDDNEKLQAALKSAFCR